MTMISIRLTLTVALLASSLCAQKDWVQRGGAQRTGYFPGGLKEAKRSKGAKQLKKEKQLQDAKHPKERRPEERAPMVFRVQLLLQEWEALDPALRALGSAQIRQLTRYHRRDLDALIDVYRASDRAGQEVIRAALWNSSEKDSSEEDLSEEDWSEDRARFERRLRRRFPSER